MTELERIRARIAQLEGLAYRDFFQEAELGQLYERLRHLEASLYASQQKPPPSTDTCEGFHVAT